MLEMLLGGDCRQEEEEEEAKERAEGGAWRTMSLMVLPKDGNQVSEHNHESTDQSRDLV